MGYVPNDMVKAIRSFLDVCYIARRNAIDEDALDLIRKSLSEFYQYRKIYIETGVRSVEQGISLPRQHSLKHYIELICLFASPTGHCSSMTEDGHKRNVKEPWRKSSRYKALGQMLITTQRNNKLLRARKYYEAHGMMNDDVIRHLPRRKINLPNRLLDQLNDESLLGKVILAQTKGDVTIRHLQTSVCAYSYTFQQRGMGIVDY